ncbi:protein of unknown function [Pararobbsia alpina]
MHGRIVEEPPAARGRNDRAQPCVCSALFVVLMRQYRIVRFWHNRLVPMTTRSRTFSTAGFIQAEPMLMVEIKPQHGGRKPWSRSSPRKNANPSSPPCPAGSPQ